MQKSTKLYSHGFGAVLLSALASHSAGAQGYTEKGLSEADFYAVIPEVVSATRMSQKLTEAPASITIIDRDMIRASGALHIPDLFRLVPGFQAFHVNSNKFGVTYHGVSDNYPRRLEVLVDGRSVYLPLLSTVDWTSIGISLDDIERIEVVRGSNVPAYGSNAFLGAINIVTRAPYTEDQASIKALAGSLDTRRVEGRFSTPLGNSHLRVTAGHDQNDGSDQFHDGARYQYLNLSSSLTPNLTDSLLLQAGFTDGHTGVGDLSKTTYPISRRDHQSNYQYLRWNHLHDIANEFQFSAYHNYLDISTPRARVADLVKYEGLPPDLAAALLLQNPDFRLDNEHGTAETYDIELQHTWRLHPQTASLLWGLGYRHDIAHSEVLLQDQGQVREDSWRLFGNLELVPADALTLNLGAMAENSSTSDTGARLSPRAAINFRPDGQSVIRLGYSQAYRMPSLLEKNIQNTIYWIDGSVYDFTKGPNNELDPERARTWELGYYRAMQPFNGYVDVRVFDETVDQAIFSQWDPAAELHEKKRIETRGNAAQWRNVGAELQLRVQPVETVWMLFNYSYINTIDVIHDKGTDPKKGGIEHKRWPQTPLHNVSALINFRFPGHWDLSAAHYYVDDVQWDEGGNLEAYNRTDLRLAKFVRLQSGRGLEGALVFQNVLGNEYSEFYKLNTFDRRGYVQLKLDI